MPTTSQAPKPVAPAPSSPGAPRTILDVSSIARWVGTPTGILRVEQALAAHVQARRPDIVLAVYDRKAGAFRQASPVWAEVITGWTGAIDSVSFDDRPNRALQRRWRSLRHPPLMVLERWRIGRRSPLLRRALDGMQRILYLGRGLPAAFVDPQGLRRTIVPVDLALGEAVALGPRDTVLTVGHDWGNQDPSHIQALQKRHGFRYVVMCHDTMALQFPNYLPDHAAAAFRRYWAAMFSKADRILVNSRWVEGEIRAHCAQVDISPAEIRLVALGSERPRKHPPAVLPHGLEAQRFILFVSTIDRRKGHEMLLDLWDRLLAAGVPQHHRFRLVLIGRRGWGMDGLIQRIGSHPAHGGSLLHLPGVDDALLARLYAATAFCVYPSSYEGFGLPIVESFAHGKAVIASSAGALPETVNGLSPCLAPDDEEAWFLMMRRWIQDPAALAAYEAKIRDSFSGPDWTEAATRIFEAAEAAADHGR